MNRFVLCSEGKKGHSKDFMPIDLELERGADNFYNIVTAYPNRIKNIEGILIFDDSTHSPSVTATDSLVRLADDKSGVSYQGANAKTSIPSEGNIAQSEDGGNDISSDEQTQKILKLFRRNLITEKETIRKLADSFAERGINDSLKKAEDIFYKEFPKPETKIPNSVEQCKNFEDLKSFWEDGYNVRFDDALKKLNFDAVKETLSGFEKALKYFPNVISRLSFIEPQKLRYNELSVIPMRFSSSAAKIHVGLQLNETVFGEKLADYKERNFNSGVTNENFGNGAHEAGHFLTLALNHKLGMASLSKKIMDFIDNLLVNRAYESIKNKVDGKALAKLKADISAYALTVDKECIAEAVSDFISNSGNAQPLSKAIFQELKSALNSDKFINEEFLAMPPVINRAKPLYQMFFAHSVNKWINAKRKDGTYQNKTDKVRQIAENLLADRELADELKALRIKEFSGTDKWAELLDAHSFDEEILLSTDDWSDSRINEMAKHSPFRRAMELLGARFIEGKVYNLDDDTRGYIARLLDGYGNPITKFSGKGDLEKMFRAAKRLSENELDGKQKKWVEFGEDYGLNIVWLDAHKDLKGAVEGGTIYFNAKTNKDIFKTFWHEQFHMMSALNPELRDDLLKYFKKTFKAEQLDAYRKENKREDLSDKETIEEILSDNFEHVQSRVKTLQEMAESPNLLKRFVAFVKNLMEKFVSIFRSPEGGMTREQRDDFIKRFNVIAASLRDIHGNKIFTTYKNGKELKHANGEKIKLVPLKFSAEKPVDNAEQESDNTGNNLTDNQKQNLFDTINRHINEYISEQVKAGKKESDVAKELTAENSRHRARTLGALKSSLRDFENRANDKEHRRLTVERILGNKNLTDAKVNEAYNEWIENLREMVDYGGVLYHEIALNRAGAQKDSRDGIQLRSWTDAERQRAERETGTGNRISEKHSKQGAFSIDEKISAAIEKDSTVKNAIATLGGEIVDGKLQADAKAKSKIEKFLDTLNEEGKIKYSIAWHGTPHDFDKFTLDAIGTGEGAQVHGWGLYFAGKKAVSEGYRERLSRDKKTGTINGKRFEGYLRDSKGFYDWTFFSPSGRKTKSLGLFSVEAQALNELVKTKGNIEKAIKNLSKYEHLAESVNFLKNNDINISFKKPGTLFKVDIPAKDLMLDEDKSFRQQKKAVQNSIENAFENLTAKQKKDFLKFDYGGGSYESFDDWKMHVRNGEDIYNKFVKALGNPKAASLALNEVGIKGITYESERDGRCYVVFDDEAIQILEKYSKRGNGDTSIKNYVGDEKLNSQQKLIKAFSEKMGMPTIFFRNANKDFHGAHTNGITYLNVNSEVPLGKVFWHETLHWMNANNPRLFKNLSDAVNLSEEQLKNYLDETGREDLQRRGEITEEILADSLHKLLSEVKDKNLLQKVVAWIKDALSKFKEMFRNPEGGLTTAQYKRLENAFGNMAKNLTDEDGNKIFRFNNRTKELELAGGEKLSTVPLTADDEQVSENTTIGNPNKNKVEIANGYYTESGKNLRASKANEFIVDSNGNENISAISETVAEKSNGEIKALPVRLKVGFHRSDTQNGNGYKHIAGKHLKEIRAHGFKNAMDFINYTLKNFDKAYKHPDKNNRIILFCDDDSRGFMPLQLIDEGNYYSIVTAFPKESKKINGELIFDRSETLSAVTADDTTKGKATDVAARTDNKGGVKSVAANVEINSPSENITQLEDNNKDEDTATVAKSLGGKLVNGEWTFDNEKSRRAFERHRQNVKNNFSGTKFSIANNDNSTESLAERIKNTLSGTNTHNERTNKKIERTLEKLSGYKIAAGHLADGIDIVVKDIQKVIRTRNANDWELVLPEVGEKIARRLNLNPTSEMKNYIAKWIMTGAPNDTSIEAKDFQRAMNANEDYYRDQLIDIRNIFQSESEKDVWERARGQIAWSKVDDRTLSQKAKDFFKDFREQFVEELAPVEDLIKSYEEETGKKLKDSENPLTSFRLYRGAAGIAKIMIEEASNGVKKALQQLMPNLKWDNFKTVADILDSIGALDDEKKRQDFSIYVAHCHVKDIHLKNHEIERQRDKLREKIDSLNEEFDNTSDKKKIKELAQKIKKAEERLADIQFYETPYTEEDCDKIINEGKEKFGAAQKDLVRFSNTLVAVAKDSGLITEQTEINLYKKWKNYVPLFRVFDENEDVAFGDSLKHMTGSKRDVIDPLLSIGRNTYRLIKRAEKNKAKILLANLAREGGVGKIIEEVDDKNPNIGTTITFYENGKKKYLETDPSVVKAVNNLSVQQMNWFLRFLRIGTTLVRNLFTIYNPSFALRNLVRDQQDAYLYTKYGYFSLTDLVKGYFYVLKDTYGGLKSALKKDDAYMEWMAFGGAQASFWSVDRDYAQSSIEQLTKGKYKRFKSASGVLEILKTLGEYSELGTRIGHFKRVKRELAKQNGGNVDRNILMQAALESRDLMDYARGGSASRNWNALSAFANAQIQGVDKFYRTFDIRKAWSKDENVRKEWQRAMIRLAITAILPTMFLFMLNGDEDWYKKDLQDWEKETHWIIGQHLRIPKGADVGIRFVSNFTEMFLNNLKNNEPMTFKRIMKPLWDATPDFMPTALQPIFECAANYDLFTNAPVVPYRLQRLPAYMQSDSRTSWAAKKIGESSFAKFFFDNGLSPKQIDHFLFGYTGNMGKGAMGVLDSTLGDKEIKIPSADWLPLIGGFLRVPYKNPKAVNDYYELLDKQTALHNEYKMTHKIPEGYNPSLYKRLTQTQKQMSKLSKQESTVLENPNISGSAKDARSETIQKQRIALVERFLK